MLRQYTIDDVILEFQQSADRQGRIACPGVARLQAMKDAGATYAQVEESNLCDQGPWLVLDIIVQTVKCNTEADAHDVQERAAYALTMHDWAESRPLLESVLHRKIEVIGPSALRILFGWILENHPNPSGFFAQIAERIPAENLSDLVAAGVL